MYFLEIISILIGRFTFRVFAAKLTLKNLAGNCIPNLGVAIELLDYVEWRCKASLQGILKSYVEYAISSAKSMICISMTLKGAPEWLSILSPRTACLIFETICSSDE